MKNSNIDPEQKIFIMDLIHKGDYQIASDLLEDFEKKNELTKTDLFYIHLYKSSILINLGFFENGYDLVKKAYSISEELNILSMNLESLLLIIDVLNHLGNLDESRKRLQKFEEYLEGIKEDDLSLVWKANYYKQMGILENISGNLDAAIECFEKSHNLIMIKGSKYEIADILNYQGIVYSNVGNLDKSMLLIAQGLAMFQEIGNPYKIADALNRLGEICRQKGFLEQALRHFQQSSAIWEQIGNKEAIAKSLTNIGTIYYGMGEFQKASVNFNFGLELFEEIGNFIGVAENLYRQILLSLAQSKINEAEKFYELLSKNSELNKHKPTDQLQRLSRALVLKNKGRFRNQVKAIDILESIVIEDIMNYEVMVDALLNLCELYLAEFKTVKETETLDDFESAILALEHISKSQKSLRLSATAYWLKAHLNLIKLNVDEAKKLFVEAQNMAEEIGLKTLAIKISNDYDELLENSDNWDKLKDDNATLSQRFELSQIDELVNNLLHDNIRKVDDIPKETPVFLTIIERSGSSGYSKEFSDKSKIDDQLIGGLLTALNSFISEAFFSDGGTIDRLKYQKYTFVMKPTKNFVFCYIFEGYSYYATKKLEEFIEKVNAYSDLEEAFNNFSQTGILPDKKFKNLLDSIVNEIFL